MILTALITCEMVFISLKQGIIIDKVGLFSSEPIPLSEKLLRELDIFII